MTEDVLRGKTVRAHTPSRSLDRIFFSAMTVVLWAIILFGFSKTYFLAGMVRAPLPNLLIHLHGGAFTLWMVLLVVQTSLVAAGRMRVHRTLGMVSFGLAVAMVILGLLSAVNALRRGSGPLGLDPETFAIIPLTDMLCFSVLVFFAYRMRMRAEMHKRFVLIASIALMGAGVGRWPVAFFQAHPPAQISVTVVLLLALAGFDLVQMGRVSRATLVGGSGLVVVQFFRVPLGMTHAWHAFTGYLLRH